LSDPVSEGLGRIQAWGEARDWRGYDPYDALNSPVAGVLSLGTTFGRRLFTQAVKLSPLNLRPVLGIRPAWNAKALALVASGYAWSGQHAAAERWLTWLAENRSGGGWGYHFPVQTRVFRYERETPNAIATAFVAQALMDGWELLGDERSRDVAIEAARFLSADMYGDGFFRYLPGEGELVHNANVLVCAVLMRAATIAGDNAFETRARQALEATLKAQRPDGSFPYAEGAGHGWVDNFHTGYVLESLAVCAPLAPEAEPALRSGAAYWAEALFLPDGTPKYTSDRLYPIDAHCYATAIDTWIALAPYEPAARERAEHLARLLVERMLEPDGHVRFQRRRVWTSNVPYVRWTAAPSFRALARVLSMAHG
jgi:polysaccharide biosynthesis protein VpsJ